MNTTTVGIYMLAIQEYITYAPITENHGNSSAQEHIVHAICAGKECIFGD